MLFSSSLKCRPDSFSVGWFCPTPTDVVFQSVESITIVGYCITGVGDQSDEGYTGTLTSEFAGYDVGNRDLFPLR